MKPMKPPHIPETVPPSRSPGKPLTTFNSLIGNPLADDGSGATATLPGPVTLEARGKPPLIVNRTETAAPVSPAVLEEIEFQRDGHVKAAIGLDSSDHLVVLAKDKTTVLVEFDTDGTQNFEMRIDRNAAAAVNPMIALSRQLATMFYIGLDASDRWSIIASDGTTVLVTISATGDVVAAGHVRASFYADGSNTQVVTTRQAAIPNGTATSGSGAPAGGTGGAPGDPATLGDVDGAYAYAAGAYSTALDALGTANTALAKINAWLDAARTHGLIAT